MDDIPEVAFDELAAELFRSYDADEAARADPSAVNDEEIHG